MKRLIAFLLFTGLCLQGDRAHGERPIPPEDIDRTFNVDYESQPIPSIEEPEPIPSEDIGRTFSVYYESRPIPKCYDVTLYKYGGYTISLTCFPSEDIISTASIARGHWKKDSDGMVCLTDGSNGTVMKATIEKDSVLRFVSAFDALMKKPLERTDLYVQDDPYLSRDSVRSFIRKHQRRPIVEAGNLSGHYGDTTKPYSLFLELTKMHKYRLYMISRSNLLSTGTWWRDKNLISLTDSTMKQNFYGLIDEKGIQSMVFPGGNRGQYLPKQN